MDPYKILGVPKSASEKEIKDAYSKLAKKYHPDLNPGNKEAEQRMKEINAAYDQIKNGTIDSSYNSNSGYGYNPFGSGFGGFSSYQNTNQSSQSNELKAAINYINSRHYKEALNALSSVPPSLRNGQWYYLSAYANNYLRNTIIALEHAQIAVQLEPNNMEYRILLDRLQNRGKSYQDARYAGGFEPVIPCNPMIVFFYIFLMRFLCFCCY